MAKLVEVIKHPGKYMERARWKAGHFGRAFRKTWLDSTADVRACNRRQETVDYGPPNIFLETASACNLKCPMCPTGAGMITRKHGFLKLDLVEKFISELRHQPAQVALWLGGEPLINPNLVEMIRLLSKKNLPVQLHTNATLLNEEKSRAIIEAGLGLISFSFDGASREQYEEQRVGGDYDKTLANIREFLQIKQSMKSTTPRVVIQTIIPFENEEVHPYGAPVETPGEVRDLFDGLPVDEYKALLAHSWSGQMDYSPMTATNHVNQGRRMACSIPYTNLTIAWNGDAVTCCGDLDAQNVLGNLYEENLYDLWNNEQFRLLRRRMHTTEIEQQPLCGTCERIWTLPHPLDYELRLSLLRYRLRF